MFPKILIANRGEIAVRVIRACKEMGISTVAVFSEADRNALHVSLADESICIGPAAVSDSYLNMTAILSAAVACDANAIHPGCGLLSENERFARLCEKCGICFIGPPADVLAAMGDKDNARRTVRAAGVPVIPGCDLIPDVEAAKAEARKIGLPVMIKARSGGGGRGIRQVYAMDEIPSAFQVASAESQAAFGDGALYMEKLLTDVHHVEVQLMCDATGRVLCLGERECSVQRRNQKLIEESPSPAVSPELRRKLYSAAAGAARAVHYEGAGTVEFLVEPSGRFYFMEMNARLQVEHPVTEMVSRFDLVKWQIRVAAGISLPFEQGDVEIDGHAIECRINAEDPARNFRPSSGRIELLHVPGGPGVRFDTALYQGYEVPPYYDSLIAKLIVHAHTRAEAIRKMQAALCEMVVEGVDHTGDLQLDLINAPAFVDGNYTTTFYDTAFEA